MTILTAPRVRFLVAYIDTGGKLSSCALVNEEDLPMPAGWVVVAQDPDDEPQNRLSRVVSHLAFDYDNKRLPYG